MLKNNCADIWLALSCRVLFIILSWLYVEQLCLIFSWLYAEEYLYNVHVWYLAGCLLNGIVNVAQEYLL